MFLLAALLLLSGCSVTGALFYPMGDGKASIGFTRHFDQTTEEKNVKPLERREVASEAQFRALLKEMPVRKMWEHPTYQFLSDVSVGEELIELLKVHPEAETYLTDVQRLCVASAIEWKRMNEGSRSADVARGYAK